MKAQIAVNIKVYGKAIKTKLFVFLCTSGLMKIIHRLMIKNSLHILIQTRAEHVLLLFGGRITRYIYVFYLQKFTTQKLISPANAITSQGTDPPDFALIPDNLYVPYGSTVTMACVAFDDDDRAEITWMLNEAELDADDLDDITVDTRLHTHSGDLYVISILKVCSIEDDDLGQFSCIASSGDGNITATWTMDAFVDSGAIITTNEVGVPPVIVIAPGPSLVTYNYSVVMTCVAYGNPNPTFTWSRFDDASLTSANSRVNVLEEVLIVGGKSYVQNTLQLCGVTPEDLGEYSCAASNDAGNTTQTFVFSYAELVLAPNNLYASYGSDVTMTCVARGMPRPAISWSIDGTYLDATTSGSVTIESRSVTQGNENFTVSLLRVCSLEESVTGEYSCLARNVNSTGADEYFWSLTGVIGLNVSATGSSPRVVLGSDAATQVTLNSTVLVTCIAYGDPLPTVTWQKDTMALSNTTESDDGVIIYNTVVNEGGRVFARSILQVCFVDDDETGVYSCIATNSLGTDTQDINLSYTEIVAIPNDIEAQYGSTVTMSCIAIGFPLPGITWSKDGSPLGNSADSVTISNRVLTEGGQTFSVSLLTVCNFGYDDIGEYSCLAANSVGATDSLSWQVSDGFVSPIIIVGPTDSLVKLENEVILNCIAYGSPTPTITWTRGGVPLNSSTSTTITVSPSTSVSIVNSSLSVAESTVEICSFGIEDIGEYGCIAESSVGRHVSRFEVDLDPSKSSIHYKDIHTNHYYGHL